MKTKLCYLLLVIACLAVPAHSFAADSSFKIKILPMDCVFETVDDGSNEIHYLTPKECRRVVPVPVTDPPAGNGGIGRQLFGLPNRANLVTITGQDVVSRSSYLNEHPEFSAPQGLRYEMAPGQAVSFSLYAKGSFELHHVTVKEITPDYVVITIASKPFDAKLFVGETKQFDATGDGKNDLQVTLKGITNGTADLAFRYLTDPANALNKQVATDGVGRSHVAYWIVGGGLAMAGLGLAVVNVARRRRYGR